MQNQNNQKISEFRFQKFHTPKDSQDFKMVRFKYVTPGLAENKRFHTFTALTASTMIWQKTALSDPMNLEDKDVLAMLVKVSWWVWWCSQKWRNRTCGRHAEHAKHANVMKNVFWRNQNPTNPVISLAPAQVHQPSGSDSPELCPSWRFSKVSRSDLSISVHLRGFLRPGCTWWTHASPVDSPQWWSRSRQLRLRKHGRIGWLVLHMITWYVFFLHQNEQWKHFRKMTHVEMEFQSFNSFDIILGLQLFYQSFKWTVNCGSDCWMDVVLHQLIGSFQPHTERTPEVTSTSGQTKIDKTWWKKWRF